MMTIHQYRVNINNEIEITMKNYMKILEQLKVKNNEM